MIATVQTTESDLDYGMLRLMDDMEDSQLTDEGQGEKTHWSDPVLAAYLKDISKEPLLNREEELLLFTIVRESREAVRDLLMKAIDMFPPSQARKVRSDTLRYEDLWEVFRENETRLTWLLSAEQMALLNRSFASWEEARKRLLTANLRLVIYAVKRFRRDEEVFLDLIQEGNIGLMRAIDRYDAERSSKFSSYALYWIWQAVNRAHTKNAYTVRIPAYKVQQLGRYHRTKRLLASGAEPLEEEEAEIARRVGLKPDEVEHIAEMQNRPVSIDASGDEDTRDLSEMLVAPGMGPDAEIEHSDMVEDLHSALASLPEREAQVLRWRYGVDSETFTLQEIGAKLCISRERVRQLEQQAIRRIQHLDSATRLQDYYRG